MKIFKYELGNLDKIFSTKRMEIPRGKIVDVDIDEYDEITIWVEISSREVANRRFTMFGTGWDIPEGSIHIKTFHQGLYVWHLYETFD